MRPPPSAARKMPVEPIAVFVDADACPVKDEVYKVAGRYDLKTYVVANGFLRVPQTPLVERVVVEAGPDAADDWIVARIAHTLSEFSFTLYVTHIPVIKLLRYVGLQTVGRDRLAAHAPLDYAVYAGMLGILLGAAWLSYLLFESHTFRVRRAVKNALHPRPQRASMASSSMK